MTQLKCGHGTPGKCKLCGGDYCILPYCLPHECPFEPELRMERTIDMKTFFDSISGAVFFILTFIVLTAFGYGVWDFIYKLPNPVILILSYFGWGCFFCIPPYIFFQLYSFIYKRD